MEKKAHILSTTGVRHYAKLQGWTEHLGSGLSSHSIDRAA